jgi:hypothetical protein
MTERTPRPGGRVALVQLVPNAMTLAAICAGITSIRFSVTGDFGLAVALQGVATLLDGLTKLVGCHRSRRQHADFHAFLRHNGVENTHRS